MQMLALPPANVPPRIIRTGEPPREIFAQGVVTEILIDPKAAVDVLYVFKDQDGPVQSLELIFSGYNDYYIRLNDHRRASILAAEDCLEAYFDIFKSVPCLGRFALRSGQYISLVDIEDPETDIEQDHQNIVLAKWPLDPDYRIIENQQRHKALHLATQICFAERK